MLYTIFLYILIFFFGGAIGSFVNVVSDRLYVKSFIKGRSHCESCNKTLTPLEMVPVFSYLFLKGRCKKCKFKFGSRHFFVELFMAIIFILTYNIILAPYFVSISNTHLLLTGMLFALFYVFLFVILGVIFLYDLKHKIVPLSFSMILLIIGLAFEVYRIFNFSVFYGGYTTLFWLDAFAGFLVALPFLLINIFSRGKAAGFGDAILFFSCGYLLGFIFGVSLLFLSVWIGALTSLILIYLLPKKYNRKSLIPFAPFIIIAVILIIFMHIDILGLASILV